MITLTNQLKGNNYYFEDPRTKTIWGRYNFSVHLKGRDGNNNGILPSNMTALSLRRSFGSLLLRSGKTTSEVAAAMGNTPSMVEKHYARILGNEVNINLSKRTS